jgi:hypothetical protein
MGVSGQRHTSTVLSTRERTPRTHWIGGWVGLKTGLDRGYRKNSLSLPGIEPR